MWSRFFESVTNPINWFWVLVASIIAYPVWKLIERLLSFASRRVRLWSEDREQRKDKYAAWIASNPTTLMIHYGDSFIQLARTLISMVMVLLLAWGGPGDSSKSANVRFVLLVGCLVFFFKQAIRLRREVNLTWRARNKHLKAQGYTKIIHEVTGRPKHLRKNLPSKRTTEPPAPDGGTT
jgi:hypothetical protein